MRFMDLGAAFEEMEWLVKDTGLSHMILHSGHRTGGYHVVQRNGWAKVPFLVAELNCRNVIGDKRRRNMYRGNVR